MTSVIVIGSGAAGLAAALSAREAGAEVTVLEATQAIGGTTALSSGAVWLPNNHLAANDSPEQAREYLRSFNGDPDLCDRFVEEAPRVSRWLEAKTPLWWEILPIPDCHGGGHDPGRSLEPRPFRPTAEIDALVRAGLPWRPPATLSELVTGWIPPGRDGTLTAGRALVAALLTAVIEAGVTIRTGTRVTRILSAGVEVDGAPLAGRVVLATGGFERDEALVRQFLGRTVPGLAGAPGARGDGLRMAIAAGAALRNTSDAWWCPTFRVPGDTIDGEPIHRVLLAERSRPGAVLIDRDGLRFTNEAQSYHEVGRTLRDSGPAWLVVDATYRRQYPIGPVGPGDPDPDWLRRGATLAELARLIDVPADTLTKAITWFNESAVDGRDPDFDRGTNAYDHVMGGPLGPLREPPLYAVPVHLGLGGTSGGPRIDADGRVLGEDGAPVPGLYAAGNVAANPFGGAYPGTGATLGPALVFGVQAGRAAAGD
jgi:succinate dehydrogenase/fumarate reductase flavoprotein subunit